MGVRKGRDEKELRALPNLHLEKGLRKSVEGMEIRDLLALFSLILVSQGCDPLVSVVHDNREH